MAVTPADESFDVHLGLTDAYSEMFRIKQEKYGVPTSHVEDGWEEWGSQVGWGINDANTQHITLRYAKLDDAITAAFDIAKLYHDILVPLKNQTVDESLNGVIITVTFGGNWDAKFLDVYMAENRTRFARFRTQQVNL